MKKVLRSIIILFVVCISLFSLFGCGGNSEVEGKYYLSSGNAQNSGPPYSLLAKDENGTYTNVVGGEISSKEFWVELKDGEMTIHGVISPVAGADVTYIVNSDTVETFKYKLESKNEAWYSIYDGNEDTLYMVRKNGEMLVFEYGSQKEGFWYSISYTKEK